MRHAGQSYNLTCTAVLDGITGPPNIEWLGPNNSVLNSSNVTVENMVTVNESTFYSTLVFSSLHTCTSHGGQYTCWTTLGPASAVTSTEFLVQSV